MSIQMQLGDYVSVRTGNRRTLYFYTGVVQEIFKSKVRVKCEITFAEYTRYETYIFPKEKIIKVGKSYEDVKN